VQVYDFSFYIWQNLMKTILHRSPFLCYVVRKQYVFILFWVFLSLNIHAQQKYTKYDYLHGELTSLRTCFNVKHYDIQLRVQPATKFIAGSNTITFSVEKDFQKMQLDLFSVMQIDSMLFYGKKVSHKQDSNAVFVDLGIKVKKGASGKLTVYFSGHPPVAKKAPWDGGFVWTKDSSGKDWVGLACEGLGASCWLPCKDHWSDEADSMDMHLQVPNTLVGVSNGRLIGQKEMQDGYTQYDWKVVNTINAYNISVNVGDYKHIHDSYSAKFNTMQEPLSLDYYVLFDNVQKAKVHFKQVHKMLEAFEKYFGPYPFWEDSYKLVETPYWGMEHQSCVAYGNDYANNRYNFDFIIVHESGHEWFGNSLTANDPAEMWIHESFTTYTEALYVEHFMGYEMAQKYLHEQMRNIQNKEPIIGVYDVNYHGRKDNDMYYKGSWMLHTLRSVIDNDTLWFNMLKELSLTYKKKNVTTAQIIEFFNKRSGRNLNRFFEQYLYKVNLPVFEYKIEERGDRNLTMSYRWTKIVRGFEMPIKLTATKGAFETVTPRKSWQLIDLNYFDEKDFKIQSDRYLIDIKKLTTKEIKQQQF
ncbi:MAG: M1 family metallopeptidase, partial [Bacteroidota bacterium]